MDVQRWSYWFLVVAFQGWLTDERVCLCGCLIHLKLPYIYNCLLFFLPFFNLLKICPWPQLWSLLRTVCILQLLQLTFHVVLTHCRGCTFVRAAPYLTNSSLLSVIDAISLHSVFVYRYFPFPNMLSRFFQLSSSWLLGCNSCRVESVRGDGAVAGNVTSEASFSFQATTALSSFPALYLETLLLLLL